MNDTEKAVEYYKCGLRQVPPPYVPKRVLLMDNVRGDLIFASTMALAGEHECKSNKYGAISVKAENGKMLGVKPAEFEVLEWTENPHVGGQQ